MGAGVEAEADAEFSGYVTGVLEDVRQKQVIIDADLDIILAGVRRLGANAAALGAEVRAQDQVMSEIAQRMDAHTASLDTTTAKVESAIRRIRGESMCVYCICVLMLIGVAGAIYVVSQF